MVIYSKDMPAEYTILLIVFLLALFIVYSPSTVKAAIIGGPFVAAPKEAIRRGLKSVGLRAGERLYDIGSGLGRVLVIGAKEFGADVTGFEYSFSLVFFSKINLLLNRVKNGRILRENFYYSDFSRADVIFIFMTPKAFPKLKERFENTVKKGARIVAYSTPLLFWKPDKVEDIPNCVGKLYYYIKK
jgi:hypothetical protein